MEWLTVLKITPGILVMAFLIDLVLGDPRWLPHPTVGTGKAALLLEKPLRALGKLIGGPEGDFLAGFLLVLLLVGGSFALTFWLTVFLSARSQAAWQAAGVFLIYSTIAVKGLAAHAREVEKPLSGGGIEEARRAVSMIVGRDVTSLDESGVARAAVESVAENASDAVVAPLFYAALGGVPLAVAYRVANTLDAMYGHMDPDNLYFGRPSARLDDLLNYLPARLTAILFIATGFLSGLNVSLAWKVLLSDGGKHKSPNSGRPEAAMAGLLNVRLGGLVAYRSGSFAAPFLNLSGRLPAGEDIGRAVKVMNVSACLALGFCIVLNLFCGFLRGF